MLVSVPGAWNRHSLSRAPQPLPRPWLRKVCGPLDACGRRSPGALPDALQALTLEPIFRSMSSTDLLLNVRSSSGLFSFGAPSRFIPWPALNCCGVRSTGAGIVSGRHRPARGQEVSGQPTMPRGSFLRARREANCRSLNPAGPTASPSSYPPLTPPPSQQALVASPFCMVLLGPPGAELTQTPGQHPLL